MKKKRGNVEFLLLIIYIFVILTLTSIFLFDTIKDSNEKLNKEVYQTLFSQNLFLILNLFQQGTKPTSDPTNFFSDQLSISDLGLTQQCGVKIIYTNYVLSKIVAVSLVDSRFYMKLLGMDKEGFNFYFKIYDSKEGKTFYYDPLTKTLSFKNIGFELSNQKSVSEKKYSYGYTFPILLVEPQEDGCKLNELKVDYPNETKKLKMVPATFYLEIYKER